MMKSKLQLALPSALAMCFGFGCKPPEPTPTLYKDLGTGESPLPPTPHAWHDPSLLKGSAELRPFRKPDENDTKSAAKPVPKPKTDGKDGDVEAGEEKTGPEQEIRTLVSDFNAALTENDLEKASEFLTDAQAEASGDVFTAINQLDEQLKALQPTAASLSEKIAALAPHLTLKDALKLEVESVRVVDEKNATATLVSGGEAKFVVGEEDFWYLESPPLAALIKERGKIEKLTADIKDALAKGTPDEAALTALGTGMDELKTALSPSAKPEADSG